METSPPIKLPQPGLGGLVCSVVVGGGEERAEAMLSEVPFAVGVAVGCCMGEVSLSKSGWFVMVLGSCDCLL